MNISSVDLNLLVALDALLSEQSVTLAAEKVGLSQPAMSHALKRLRDTLNDPLLVRAGQTMTLTPRAIELRVPVREVLDRVQNLIAPAKQFDPATSREKFYLAANEYAQLAILPTLINRLTHHAPYIDLRFRERGHNTPLPMLESGELDLAITLGLPEHIPDTLYRLDLFQLDLVCVARKDHPQVKDELDIDTFCALPHILISPKGDESGVVDLTLEKLGMRRRVALVVPHFLIAPHIVANSDCLLTTARTVAETYLESLPIKILKPPLQLQPGTVSLVWHPRTHHNQSHRWLRRFIAAQTANMP